MSATRWHREDVDELGLDGYLGYSDWTSRQTSTIEMLLANLQQTPNHHIEPKSVLAKRQKKYQ